MRPEIQALRAVAVAVVVIYHLWPLQLPGGFVGVDMFFAISGFLITAHLVREVQLTSRVNVLQFWARRIRRLLPASLLVLGAAAIATLAVAPLSRWAQFFREIGASALYIENWQLAGDAVDYLAAENEASPVQHFWSLSAEEQFYLVWPLLIVAAIFVAARFAVSKTRAILAVLVVVTVASLIYSIALTASDPAIAYFITPTRAWEFGLGGILAILAPHVRAGSENLRTAVSWAGWVLLGVTVVFYSDALPFPSFTALLPVVATLAILWAGNDGLRPSPTVLARWAPVQRLGDISYSVYLWHWPLIVLVPLATRHENTLVEKLAILAATLVLAWLTKRFVEDPVRRGALSRARPRVTFLATVVAMAVVIAGCGVGVNAVTISAENDRVTAQRLLDANTPCFGAAALDPANQPCAPSELDSLIVPAVGSAAYDRSPTWDECRSLDTEARECVLGTPGGTRVALVGDSHTHQWITAMESLAETENWELHVYVRGGCPFGHVDWKVTSEKKNADCAEWNDNVDVALAAQEPFEYVFTSMRLQDSRKLAEDAAVGQPRSGFLQSWQPLIDRGATVVAIRGVPRPMQYGRKCVTESLTATTSCYAEADFALTFDDVLAESAATVDGATVVDLTSFFCVDDRCPAIIGGVLVYRDDHHITATYASTLAPYILAGLREQELLAQE